MFQARTDSAWRAWRSRWALTASWDRTPSPPDLRDRDILGRLRVKRKREGERERGRSPYRHEANARPFRLAAVALHFFPGFHRAHRCNGGVSLFCGITARPTAHSRKSCDLSVLHPRCNRQIDRRMTWNRRARSPRERDARDRNSPATTGRKHLVPHRPLIIFERHVAFYHRSGVILIFEWSPYAA